MQADTQLAFKKCSFSASPAHFMPLLDLENRRYAAEALADAWLIAHGVPRQAPELKVSITTESKAVTSISLRKGEIKAERDEDTGPSSPV